MNEEITTALTTVSTELTKQINPASVAGVIGLVLASAVGLYLLWFGIRKLVSVAKNALKGKLKI